MKIGILTLPFSPNYGWALQLWALTQFLKANGHEPIVIERKWNRESENWLYKFQCFVYYHILCRHLWRFNETRFEKTGVIRSGSKIPHNQFDAFVVGSDQVWRIENTRGADLNFFLDFLPDDSKSLRIAYAASFGKDQWKGTQEETEKVGLLLKKFDFVSVREDTGVSLCKEIFNIESHHVLDPTLLLSQTYYSQLIDCKKNSKHVLATYILDATDNSKKIVDNISGYFSLSVHHLFKRSNTSFYIYHSIEHWLQTMRDADYVVVDSFHGLCFCLVFEKQFLVIANKKRGLTRFVSLLESVGLQNRLIYEDCEDAIEKCKEQIDFKPVRKRLKEMRLASSELLLNALSKNRK